MGKKKIQNHGILMLKKTYRKFNFQNIPFLLEIDRVFKKRNFRRI